MSTLPALSKRQFEDDHARGSRYCLQEASPSHRSEKGRPNAYGTDGMTDRAGGTLSSHAADGAGDSRCQRSIVNIHGSRSEQQAPEDVAYRLLPVRMRELKAPCLSAHVPQLRTENYAIDGLTTVDDLKIWTGP